MTVSSIKCDKNQSEWKILDNSHNVFELTKLLGEVYTTTYLNNEANRQEIYRKSREEKSFQKLKIRKFYQYYPKVFKEANQDPYIVQKILSPAVVLIKSLHNQHASPLYMHVNKLIRLDERKQHLVPASPDNNPSRHNPPNTPDNVSNPPSPHNSKNMSHNDPNPSV